MEKIINNLNAKIAKSGTNIKRLCIDSGVSYASFYKFMRGQSRDIKLSTLTKVCKTLKVNLKDLL